MKIKMGKIREVEILTYPKMNIFDLRITKTIPNLSCKRISVKAPKKLLHK